MYTTYLLMLARLKCIRGLHSVCRFPSLHEINAAELVRPRVLQDGQYFVERSRLGNLPVYLSYKTKMRIPYTEICNIHGDIVSLRNDLQTSLPFIPRESWKILPQSRKLVIKGDAAQLLRQALAKSF